MTLWMFLRRYLNMHSLKYSTTHVRQLMFIYIEMFTDTAFISQPNSCAPRPYISLITVTSLVFRTAALTSIGPNLKPGKENTDTIWRMLTKALPAA